MLVADTNVLIELFLPPENSAEVQQWRAADKDWQLPALWVFEFRHILLKYLRAERLDLHEAIANLVEAERLFLPRTRTVSSADSLQLAHRHGCSSYDAEWRSIAFQSEVKIGQLKRRLEAFHYNLASTYTGTTFSKRTILFRNDRRNAPTSPLQKIRTFAGHNKEDLRI